MGEWLAAMEADVDQTNLGAVLCAHVPSSLSIWKNQGKKRSFEETAPLNQGSPALSSLRHVKECGA